ncbi:2-amino-4-hydroxy-6-hydroxymethyldihydropteridine diphosphokinase [Hazenella coriacea]|uniref:2-amino-4-hydroxy-6- hydroxymethyldihydropteridine diphosphokinase n=1 Tax=Hazenella coriacea TaxID=1179467 RepID=UPI001052D9DE
MVTAYLGLGANLGDPLSQLQQAIESIHYTHGICVTRISSVYKTAPVGYEDQPSFYNMVVEVHTTLSPFQLLSSLLQIEKKMHRVREVRWGPRTIDIDILLYDQRIIQHDDLQIPHPRMIERAFVMVPLAELNSEIMIPDSDQTVGHRAAQLQVEQEIRLLPSKLQFHSNYSFLST